MRKLATSRWVTLGTVLLIALAALNIACNKKSATSATGTTQMSEKTGRAEAGVLPASSWVVPQDVKPSNGVSPSQSDWENFGWQTFVAINWPSATPSAAGISGLPNTQLTIGASSSNGAMIPAVWGTFRSENNTMLAAAQDPGPWSNNPVPIPSGCAALTSSNPVSPGFQPVVFAMISKFGNVNQASGPPLIEQSGWYVTYDIRLDQSEYTYLQQNGYYNGATQQSVESKSGQLLPIPRTGQEAMFNPPLPMLAQYGALEVKTAWRVLDPQKDQAIIPRYFTQWGYFLQQDGTTCQGPTLFGLIGLHILRLTPTTPATWFWATFEQVDNVTAPPGGASATLAAANTPNGNCTAQDNVPPPIPSQNIPWNGTAKPVTNVCQVTNISSSVQQINQNWQGNLAGTVWQYYQLIDTINPSVTGGPQYPIPVTNSNVNTNILANTTMETYVQGAGPGNGQSCMDCHGYATPQGAQQNANNQVFSFLFSNANAPTGVNAAYRKRPLPRNVQRILQNMQSRSKK